MQFVQLILLAAIFGGNLPPEPVAPPAAVAARPTLTIPDTLTVLPGEWAAITPTVSGVGELAWVLPDGGLTEVAVSGLFVLEGAEASKPKLLGKVFRGSKPGTYRVLVVGAGNKTLTPVATCRVTVEGAQPIPPGPGPGPDPAPGPFAPSKLFILVIEEDENAAKNRGAYFTNTALAQRNKEKGHVPRWVDKDVKGPDKINPPADVAPYILRAKGKSMPQLFLIDTEGRVRFAGDLPANPEALLAQIIKVGG